MGISEAVSEALRLLNSVEIRGERSIAAMGRVISILKGIAGAIEQTKEEHHDGHDQQG